MRRVAIVAAVVLCLSARSAHASGHLPMPDYFGPLAFVLLLVGLAAPSDLGAEIPEHDPADGIQFVLGWSWQIPLPPTHNGDFGASDHHLLGGFDYLPENDDGHFIGRFGYRYSHAHLLAGLTAAFGHAGWGWSPEIGVKLAHSSETSPSVDPSLHLLARANLGPEFHRFDGVSVLLGWSIF